MDLLSFASLCESCDRLDASSKLEGLWTSFVAAQGDNDNVKEWSKKWQDLLGQPEDDSSGQDDFLARHGKGI